VESYAVSVILTHPNYFKKLSLFFNWKYKTLVEFL
jgi:hypothetical protein